MGMGYPAQSAIAAVLESIGQQKKKKAMEDTLDRARQKGYDIEISIDPETGKQATKLHYKGKTQSELMKDQLEMEMLKTIIGGQGQGQGQGQTQSGGFRPKGFSMGGVNFEREPSEQEYQEEISRKAQEQGAIATEKERQVNVGKVGRLSNMANIIEQKWAETKPGKGFKGRISGLLSVPASIAQATNQQQIDSSYRSFVRGMRAQLARAMGEVGNLSEPEQAAAMELVPGLGDNYETGTKKIKIIRDFVTTIKSGNADKAKGILINAGVLNNKPQNQDNQLEVGAYYENAQGIRKKYLGNNRWGD